MNRAPWWAPRGYTRGASGVTAGKRWAVASGRGLPIMVDLGDRRVSIDPPWWCRGVLLQSAHVRSLIRQGVLS